MTCALPKHHQLPDNKLYRAQLNFRQPGIPTRLSVKPSETNPSRNTSLENTRAERLQDMSCSAFQRSSTEGGGRATKVEYARLAFRCRLEKAFEGPSWS